MPDHSALLPSVVLQADRNAVRAPLHAALGGGPGLLRTAVTVGQLRATRARLAADPQLSEAATLLCGVDVRQETDTTQWWLHTTTGPPALHMRATLPGRVTGPDEAPHVDGPTVTVPLSAAGDDALLCARCLTYDEEAETALAGQIAVARMVRWWDRPLADLATLASALVDLDAVAEELLCDGAYLAPAITLFERGVRRLQDGIGHRGGRLTSDLYRRLVGVAPPPDGGWTVLCEDSVMTGYPSLGLLLALALPLPSAVAEDANLAVFAVPDAVADVFAQPGRTFVSAVRHVSEPDARHVVELAAAFASSRGAPSQPPPPGLPDTGEFIYAGAAAQAGLDAVVDASALAQLTSAG